ncbi:MAG: methyltransferase [Promethearchaeota archaeon]
MAYPNKLSEKLRVYSPQEDTWFLFDVLKSQLKQDPLNQLPYLVVCEVGAGSGFISIELSKKFPQIQFLATDISLQSIITCHKNMFESIQRDRFDVVCMDLLHGLNPETFQPEIIFFNPPYVRTCEEEVMKAFSWAGGPSGLVVIQKFLEDLSRFSFRKAFFLSSVYNENKLLKTNFQGIFESQVIAERKIEDERLLCYEVQLKNNPE